MPAEQLGELAAEVFGAERVHVAPRLDDAIERAVTLAEADGAGAPGVLVTGSVVLVGEARTLLVTEASESERDADRDELDDDWDPGLPDEGGDPGSPDDDWDLSSPDENGRR